MLHHIFAMYLACTKLYNKKVCSRHGSLRSSGTVLLKGLLLDQVSLDHKNVIFISSNEDKFHGAFSTVMVNNLNSQLYAVG